MITGRDFIFTGLQPWDISIGSNAKDIALEISKNNRVLYVNAPRKGISNYKINKITDNLWTLDTPVKMVPINTLPDGFMFDYINKFNQKRISKYIIFAIKKLRLNNYIHIIDNDIYNSFFLKEFLRTSYTLYYRRDNMLNVQYWQKHAPRLEPLLCEKCDCVISNSLELADAVRPYNKNVFDVGQGVDLSNYSPEIKYIIPSDISSISHPIIGYAGMITSLRLDVELIYNFAKNKEEISFVFVGKEDNIFKAHKIHQLRNVYFLGAKDPSLMPNYISAFDICINPQVINMITIGNYPRKIDEYLAMGKPTVATETHTMKDIFSDYVFLASNTDEYIKAIDNAILEIGDEKKAKKRIDFAHTHSWANSVEEIYKCIENFGA
ncbi:MAG: glycosyltransferase [Muribaculaceae bacterium]